MKIVMPSIEFINPPDYETVLSTVEQAGRVCYRSEDKITEGSAERFIRALISRGHESVIEHAVVTVRFVCDRGVSHEIVRHRIASYSQESTRYCGYSKDKFGNELAFIQPSQFAKGSLDYEWWLSACDTVEAYYLDASEMTPEKARAILPNSLKTELVMTANMREWRHFLKLRTSKAAHPDMRVLALQLLKLLIDKYPVFFEDLITDE